MVNRVFIICSCLFVFTGCIYNDEPMPEIIPAGCHRVVSPPMEKKQIVLMDTGKDAPREWLPPRHLEDRTRWQGIVIHHSAADYGCADHEHEYHKSLGWDGLGYHFVINNGVFKNSYGRPDGYVEVSYRWRQQKDGSHCRPDGDHSNYWNKHTIGICLIGNFNKTRPTRRQWRSLVKLVCFLQNRYNIPTNQIKGHRDIKPTDCPGKYFSMAELKRELTQYK